MRDVLPKLGDEFRCFCSREGSDVKKEGPPGLPGAVDLVKKTLPYANIHLKNLL